MPPRITGPYSARPTEPEIPNQRKFAEIGKWKGQRQVVLVFTPSPAKTPYKQFLSEIAGHEEDLAALSAEVVLVLETGRAPRDWNYLPGQQAVKARYQFEVSGADFAIVLLGRDGRVKQRWSSPIDYEELALLPRANALSPPADEPLAAVQRGEFDESIGGERASGDAAAMGTIDGELRLSVHRGGRRGRGGARWCSSRRRRASCCSIGCCRNSMDRKVCERIRSFGEHSYTYCILVGPLSSQQARDGAAVRGRRLPCPPSRRAHRSR